MLLPFWREVTFDFDSPKNHWLFSVSDDAPEEKASCDRHKPKENNFHVQQGPELTQDAPTSADSESAEPENPSEMPEPPDVDMTETDVSDGSSEMRKFQLHWLQLHKWLKFDSKLNKMFCQVCIDATHPIHTADCERAFSSQNLVTTALRNRLGTETCDQLMRVKLETPNKMKEFEFTDALLEWRKVKDRIIFQKNS